MRYLSSLQRCILDIYRDNSLVLSSLDSASISFFVNLLSSQQVSASASFRLHIESAVMPAFV